MDWHVRIAIASQDAPGSVAASTQVLKDRLGELVGAEDTWAHVRSEPRPGAPPALGPIEDIVLEFTHDHLLPDALKAGAVLLVRAIIGHFRAQPDPSQSAEITQTGLHIVLTSDMTPEELRKAEEEFRRWVEEHETDEE
ncbi:hypothetical protein [Streptomyces sp. NPDC052701]|uniref:hypothetical protein n=1 Tax=Streptomyces sp. NPDC052701 TaxID=3155533 RepID=UPI003436F112